MSSNYTFDQDFYCYYLNVLKEKNWSGSKMGSYKNLKDLLNENNIYSDELLEFLNNTLNIDYKKRLSAEECLKLKWLN